MKITATEFRRANMTTLVKAGDVLKDVLKKFEYFDSQVNWLLCPSCGEEWTRLRPCGFFVEDDYGKKNLTRASVCIDCAEGVRAFNHLNSLYPLPGAEIEVRTWPSYYYIPKENRHKTHFYAYVSYGDMIYQVYANETAPHLVVHRDKVKMYFDNSFQAWLYIRECIMKGDNPTEEVKWGKK
jgi:hypothetical protein